LTIKAALFFIKAGDLMLFNDLISHVLTSWTCDK